MGRLYVVATPIGNMEDITLRALSVLRQVTLIAAEDTRTTGKLLARHGIETPMISFFEHNEIVREQLILARLDSGDVALVSEAGTPGISDPGYRLISAAAGAGIDVVSIPGASAITAALAVSGLPTDSFVYLGFLPRRSKQRRDALSAVVHERRTLVIFEAPHRILRSLEDILDILGDREIAVARELTKLHEEILRGRVSELRAHLAETPPRGEFTLVIQGSTVAAERWPEGDVRQALSHLLDKGHRRREAARQLAAESGWTAREIYELREAD